MNKGKEPDDLFEEEILNCETRAGVYCCVCTLPFVLLYLLIVSLVISVYLQ